MIANMKIGIMASAGLATVVVGQVDKSDLCADEIAENQCGESCGGSNIWYCAIHKYTCKVEKSCAKASAKSAVDLLEPTRIGSTSAPSTPAANTNSTVGGRALWDAPLDDSSWQGTDIEAKNGFEVEHLDADKQTPIPDKYPLRDETRLDGGENGEQVESKNDQGEVEDKIVWPWNPAGMIYYGLSFIFSDTHGLLGIANELHDLIFPDADLLIKKVPKDTKSDAKATGK